MDINSLKAMRNEAITRAEDIAKVAEKEARNLSTDEQGAYDKAMGEATELRARINRAEEIDREKGVYPATAPQPEVRLDMTNKEVKRYSLFRAVNAQVTGDWSKAPFERECSDEVTKRFDREPKGFYVPLDVLERRTLTVGSGTGNELVATDMLSSSFIGLLRNRVVVRQAGARLLTGLVGGVAIPKHTTGTTAYWLAESGTPTESASAYDQVTMTPKTVAAYQDISRKTLQQSSVDVENLIWEDLANTLAIAIDYAALHGSGANNQPSGLATYVTAATAGKIVGGTNGAAPDWADIISMETEVAVDNADVGALAYITNPKVRGKLKQTVKVSSTDSIMVWAEGGFPLNGYKAFVSNQASSTLTKGTATEVCSAIFYGNWNDLLIGMWGGLDLMADPYSLSTASALRLVAFQDVDIAVRYPQSFAGMLDALTT